MMNRFAYLTSGIAVKTLFGMSKANIQVHGEKNIPKGAIIFAVNHFTRIETLILPSYIYELTNIPVWSLADYTLFKGSLKSYFDHVGVVSTKDPDRDFLIIKTLLNADASWIIFPEGRMVKNKKIVDKGRFMISHDTGKHPPHTGAASLALRTEFYRQRLKTMSEIFPEEAKRLAKLFEFEINSINSICTQKTYIVPVNITYYPLRAQENILTRLAAYFSEDIGERTLEEIKTEGTMILSGVDVDVRFGKPIEVHKFMDHSDILKDIKAKKEILFDDSIASARLLRKAAQNMMVQYMESIYQMTTVNHDHLFASMIRQMPFGKIDLQDLRRRVFLVASLNFKAMNLCFHQSFKADQIHLLTDDRYNKVKDFMNSALEKGVIKFYADGLKKNKDMFSSPIHFHKVRLENPLSVIANELEPLKMLQREIRRVARMPRFWVRRTTLNYLMEKDQIEFERDYKHFYAEGESHPKNIGRPFFIKGESRDIGILLIHGYMAAPAEMLDLANYLGRRGLCIYVPRLKGHGTSPEDLGTRTYEDWVASADRGYAIIRNSCKKVIVGGFSTGAALAMDLAARIKDVEGVFAICPPRRLKDLSLKKNLAKDLWHRLKEMTGHESSVKEEFIQNIPENPHISYQRNPVAGIREIERFMDDLEPKLPKIRIPSLVVHTRQDPVADHKASRRIFELLGAPDKQYVLFNFERHGIISGKGAKRVHHVIADFIDHFIV